MIYIELDLRKSTNNLRKTLAEELKVTLGPFVEIKKGGYGGDISGIKEDGTILSVFEATIGHGGSCDTCAYDYVDFACEHENKSWDVLNFRIFDK